MAIITVKDLSFAYDGKTVLEGVNFTLSAGDYLCVVGENGSGKSTLVKGLLGLKAPDGGSIVFGEGLKPTEIGYLPQQTQLQRDQHMGRIQWVVNTVTGRKVFDNVYVRDARQLMSRDKQLTIQQLLSILD